MRRLVPVCAVVLILLSCLPSLAYKSEKPLYAAVAVNQVGTKVLKLAFDESGGTGKGYDIVYADTNFNGEFTDDEVVIGTLDIMEDYTHVSFPIIAISVPFNEKAKGLPNSMWVHFQYDKSNSEDSIENAFCVNAFVTLADKSGAWDYTLVRGLTMSSSLASVKPVKLSGKCKLELAAMPDPRKDGFAGISALLFSGGLPMDCARGTQPVNAHVVIKNQQGKVEFSQDISMRELRPG